MTTMIATVENSNEVRISTATSTDILVNDERTNFFHPRDAPTFF
jgi:hypothetical protein